MLGRLSHDLVDVVDQYLPMYVERYIRREERRAPKNSDLTSLDLVDVVDRYIGERNTANIKARTAACGAVHRRMQDRNAPDIGFADVVDAPIQHPSGASLVVLQKNVRKKYIEN